MTAVLRCLARDTKGKLCRGHCGVVPIPDGFRARYREALAGDCPEPDGSIITRCSRCEKWVRFEVVVDVPQPVPGHAA